MFKILDKRNGEVTAEQQAVFNKISTNNADGYVDGFLNSLRIAKMSSNVISIDSGLLSIQGFRSVNDTLTTYTVSVTPSEPIPFQLVATYSHFISDENDTLEITTRPTQELRREPLFAGQNAVYEVELAEFNMTADGIADFAVTLEKIVYNEQDLSELLDKVTKAEQDSATALEKVNELETQVIEKQGTAVYVGGEAQTRVDFDSDPQTQIAKAQSDISDIVDGSQTAKKAEQDADGNVIDTTYSKLSQVVRVDAAQSLTDAQKQQALNNVGRPYKNGHSTQKEWLCAAKISFPYAPSAGGYNIVFLVGESNNYMTFGLLQLSGTTISGSGFYETNLRYINFNASSTQQFGPGYIKAVKVNNLELDLYIKQTSTNFTIVGLQVLSNFGQQKPDITVLLEAADDPGSGDNVTYSSEPTVRANYISSNGSPVLVGSAPTWVTGTSGSLTLPSAGWYVVGTFDNNAGRWFNSETFFYWKGTDFLFQPLVRTRDGDTGALRIEPDGTMRTEQDSSGTNISNNLSYYKLA